MCFDLKNGKKNIFQWGNPGERLSECVEGVEIYKINLKKITYLKSFMQRIIQKPIRNSQEHWCSSNCLRLVIGRSRTLTFPKLCVMVLTICSMFQSHNLEAKSCNRKLANSRKNLCQGIFGIASVWRDLTEATIVHSLCVGVNGSLRLSLLFSSQVKLLSKVSQFKHVL